MFKSWHHHVDSSRIVGADSPDIAVACCRVWLVISAVQRLNHPSVPAAYSPYPIVVRRRVVSTPRGSEKGSLRKSRPVACQYRTECVVVGGQGIAISFLTVLIDVYVIMFFGRRLPLFGLILLIVFSLTFSRNKSDLAVFIAPCMARSARDRINLIAKGAMESEGPVFHVNYQEDVSPSSGAWHIIGDRIEGKGCMVREHFGWWTGHQVAFPLIRFCLGSVGGHTARPLNGGGGREGRFDAKHAVRPCPARHEHAV